MNQFDKKEQEFFMIIGFVLGIFGSTFIYIIVFSIYKESNIIPIIQAGGSVAVGFSAIIAFCVYRGNVKKWVEENERKISLEYLNESKNLLDRAYNTLTSNGKHTDQPRSDRLVWLTTARFLLSFQKTKRKIIDLKNLDHIDIIEEQEEFWRHQFYLLLSNDGKSFPLSYYEKQHPGYPGDYSNLAPCSLAVVYSFSEWPDDKRDSLKEVNEAKLLSKGTLLNEHHGLAQYIEKFNKIQSEIDKIKT